MTAAMQSTSTYVLCLAAGDYGQFDIDATKPGGRLVVRAQEGAKATVRFFAMRGGNMTFEGLSVPSFGSMDTGTWRDVTFRGNEFTGTVSIRAQAMNQNNILFDSNAHVGFREGTMIQLPVRGANPAGLTIQNSVFRGGTADAIQTGMNGLDIVGNTFLDIVQNDSVCSACHTDVIQLIGAKNTVIKGNFFRNVSVPVGGFDGPNDTITIEDNVGVTIGSVNTLVVGSAYNTVIRHNTMLGDHCNWSGNCGWVRLGSKDSARPGGNVVVKDNIGAKLVPEITPVQEHSNNLWYATGSPAGVNNQTGRPMFACGCLPSSYLEAKLAAGSPGKASASDGLDRGARIP